MNQALDRTRTIKAMSDQWANRMSGGVEGSARAFQFVVRQPSWAARVVLIVVALALLVLLAAVVIPVVVIGGVAVFVLAMAARVRAWIGGVRSPNGALDGRRNVRVVVRE
jgi:hypothetical protein